MIVDQLLAEAAKWHVKNAILRVHPGNQTAIGCYSAAGFTRVQSDVEQKWNFHQPFPYAWFERFFPQVDSPASSEP